MVNFRHSWCVKPFKCKTLFNSLNILRKKDTFRQFRALYSIIEILEAKQLQRIFALNKLKYYHIIVHIRASQEFLTTSLRKNFVILERTNTKYVENRSITAFFSTAYNNNSLFFGNFHHLFTYLDMRHP